MADFSSNASTGPFGDPNNITGRLAAFGSVSKRTSEGTPSPSQANSPPKPKKQSVTSSPKKGSSATGSTIDKTTVAPVTATAATKIPASLNGLDFPVGDTYRVSQSGPLSRTLGDDVEEICTISLSAFDGSEIVQGYSRFFLQSVAEAEQEKYQVVETFTAFYAFFFGKRPPIYRYSGVLLNDSTHNWMNDFRYVYENFIRGTKASEFGGQTTIAYDKRVVSGFILSLNINQEAMTDKGVPFSIDVLVMDHSTVSFSDDITEFIAQKTTELAALKQRAEEDLARLNKDVNTEKSIMKNQVLTGGAPSSSITKADPTKINPNSGKKDFSARSSSLETSQSQALKPTPLGK